MAKSLRTIGATAAAYAAAAIVERFIPAIAAGLVALAHELHPISAEKEAKRRMGR